MTSPECCRLPCCPHLCVCSQPCWLRCAYVASCEALRSCDSSDSVLGGCRLLPGGGAGGAAVRDRGRRPVRTVCAACPPYLPSSCLLPPCPFLPPSSLLPPPLSCPSLTPSYRSVLLSPCSLLAPYHRFPASSPPLSRQLCPPLLLSCRASSPLTSSLTFHIPTKPFPPMVRPTRCPSSHNSLPYFHVISNISQRFAGLNSADLKCNPITGTPSHPKR